MDRSVAIIACGGGADKEKKRKRMVWSVPLLSKDPVLLCLARRSAMVVSKAKDISWLTRQSQAQGMKEAVTYLW